jgi:hypothetical protein
LLFFPHHFVSFPVNSASFFAKFSAQNVSFASVFPIKTHFFEIKKAGRPGDALRLARLARALPHPDPVLRMLARIGRDHSGGGLVDFLAYFGVFEVVFGAGIGFFTSFGRKMSTIGTF